MESKLPVLLEDAVGEPPRRITVAAVRRRVARRRAKEAMAAVALVAVVPALTGAVGTRSGPARAERTPPTIYVVNGNGVVPVPVATNKPGKLIKAGQGTDGIAITPDGSTAYVLAYTSGTVTPVATATNTPGKPIKVGAHPPAIAITPNGQTLYAVSRWGRVTVISTATN